MKCLSDKGRTCECGLGPIKPGDGAENWTASLSRFVVLRWSRERMQKEWKLWGDERRLVYIDFRTRMQAEGVTDALLTARAACQMAILRTGQRYPDGSCIPRCIRDLEYLNNAALGMPRDKATGPLTSEQTELLAPPEEGWQQKKRRETKRDIANKQAEAGGSSRKRKTTRSVETKGG